MASLEENVLVLPAEYMYSFPSPSSFSNRVDSNTFKQLCFLKIDFNASRVVFMHSVFSVNCVMNFMI